MTITTLGYISNVALDEVEEVLGSLGYHDAMSYHADIVDGDNEKEIWLSLDGDMVDVICDAGLISVSEKETMEKHSVDTILFF